MSPRIVRFLTLCCCLALLSPIPASTNAFPNSAAKASTYGALQELISPSFDYAAWYNAQTGYTGNTTYFGAYKLEPAGDTLYLGFGTARPAEYDGALFASSDGVTLTAIYSPTEQGFIDMTWQGGALYIPGADPTDPATAPDHQWDWGNTYVYTPTLPVVKHRNLEDVIHTWGNYYDAANNKLYVAASSHLGDYATWTGEVWSTPNAGSDWTRVADKDDGIGQYRTYDIIGFENKLYVTWNDSYYQYCGLAYSADGGATWQRLAALNQQTVCRTRLFVWNSQLLALRYDQAALFAIAPDNLVSTYALPDFAVRDWSYNYLATAADGYVYTITDDGRIVRSDDLSAWETMAASDRPLFTLAYWPNKNWLLAADRGRNHAQIFKLDLDTASAIIQPGAPVVSASIAGGQIKLDWADGPAGYRVYRSATPYFSSDIRLLAGTPTLSEFSDNRLGDVNTNYYYIVRNADAPGNLSPDSNITGEFDFPLTPGS